MDAAVFHSPDWALVSPRPFDTVETLTVSMRTGEVYTILVTDFQEIQDASADTIDVNKSYIIAHRTADGRYQVLKTDGACVTLDANYNLDRLNSEYRWMFNYVFEKKTETETMGYIYYMIRGPRPLLLSEQQYRRHH